MSFVQSKVTLRYCSRNWRYIHPRTGKISRSTQEVNEWHGKDIFANPLSSSPRFDWIERRLFCLIRWGNQLLFTIRWIQTPNLSKHTSMRERNTDPRPSSLILPLLCFSSIQWRGILHQAILGRSRRKGWKASLKNWSNKKIGPSNTQSLISPPTVSETLSNLQKTLVSLKKILWNFVVLLEWFLHEMKYRKVAKDSNRTLDLKNFVWMRRKKRTKFESFSLTFSLCLFRENTVKYRLLQGWNIDIQVSPFSWRKSSFHWPSFFAFLDQSLSIDTSDYIASYPNDIFSIFILFISLVDVDLSTSS